jgi:hypothetical protein
MAQVRKAVRHTTYSKIRHDKDLAEQMSEAVYEQLIAFFEKRESYEKHQENNLIGADSKSGEFDEWQKTNFHVHHTVPNHKEFAFKQLQHITLSRKKILNAQQQKRKYLFNS